jgi:hypothetical protein
MVRLKGDRNGQHGVCARYITLYTAKDPQKPPRRRISWDRNQSIACHVFHRLQLVRKRQSTSLILPLFGNTRLELPELIPPNRSSCIHFLSTSPCCPLPRCLALPIILVQKSPRKSKRKINTVRNTDEGHPRLPLSRDYLCPLSSTSLEANIPLPIPIGSPTATPHLEALQPIVKAVALVLTLLLPFIFAWHHVPWHCGPVSRIFGPRARSLGHHLSYSNHSL